MIQELFGVSGLLAAADQNPKIPTINNGNSILDSNSPATSTTTSTTAAVTAAATSNSEAQNLRCPRCDSSNTKFCYYNNYNLTQPRHFCKTCRRYWTKGGALRNVPIGGGCRKNKTAAAAAAAVGGKMKTVSSAAEILGRVGFGLNGSVLDHEIKNSPTQILWGSPQNSQLLAILRSAARHQNPSRNINNNKNILDGCHVINDSPETAFHGRPAMGFEPANNVSSFGLCGSYWRNNQTQVVHQPNGYVHGGADQVTGGGGGSGVQELYQKLKSSSSGNYLNNGHQASVGTATATATTAANLETAAAGGGDTTGYWNPAFFLSDVHASVNGAYP